MLPAQVFDSRFIARRFSYEYTDHTLSARRWNGKGEDWPHLPSYSEPKKMMLTWHTHGISGLG